MTCIPTRSSTGKINCWPRRLTFSAASRDQTMMRHIDELHLELPFAGARMSCDLLRAERFAVGRKHMTTLMQRMRITAATPQAEHEQTSAGALDLPVPAAHAGDHALESRLGDGQQLHPDGAWLRLSGRRDRLAQPTRAGLASVDLDGHGVLHRGRRRRRSPSTASRRSSTPTRAVSLGSGNRRNIDVYNTCRPHSSHRARTPDGGVLRDAASAFGRSSLAAQRPLIDRRELFRSSGPALLGSHRCEHSCGSKNRVCRDSFDDFQPTPSVKGERQPKPLRRPEYQPRLPLARGQTSCASFCGAQFSIPAAIDPPPR